MVDREIVKLSLSHRMQHVLGSGNFGKVSKGQWECGEGPVEVAVKTLKSGSSEEEAVRFLQEAAIMGQFRHPNIVQLLGVVTLTEPVSCSIMLKRQTLYRDAVYCDVSFVGISRL